MVTWLPYVHSPEEGTPEADAQPWTIHLPVQPWPDDDSPDVTEEPDLRDEDDPTRKG